MELSNITSLQYRNRINSFCMNMQQSCGVSLFVIYLIFKNKDIFVLSNIYSHLSDYYEHKYFTHDHSTSFELFKDSFYICENHLGMSKQYNTILTLKHNVHRAYYQMFKTDEFDLVLGAASDSPQKDLKAFYSRTHKDFNNFIIRFIEKNLPIFLSQNPELKHSPYFSNQGVKKIFSHKNKQLLTTRELVCLELTAKGLTAEKISSILKISKHTVDQYKKNILCKLNATNMPNAIYISMKSKLLNQNNITGNSPDIDLMHFRNIS